MESQLLNDESTEAQALGHVGMNNFKTTPRVPFDEDSSDPALCCTHKKLPLVHSDSCYYIANSCYITRAMLNTVLCRPSLNRFARFIYEVQETSKHVMHITELMLYTRRLKKDSL